MLSDDGMAFDVVATDLLEETTKLVRQQRKLLDIKRCVNKKMDCFGAYFTHAQTCENVRVQSATQWTASVHILHMPKPVTILTESS